MFKAEISEFKGHKTICIIDGYDRRVISFGLNKAKAILACISDVEKFVNSNKSESLDLDNLTDEQKDLVMKFIKG
jgi:hypothetical protein